MQRGYQIAAYYFPNYHFDTQNEKWHGSGWTEWELVKRAEPRFEGHQQPKIPLWGYEDESKPEVMEKKIKAAADHGITAFIFDWYWYGDGPYLQRALEEGFLKAKNNNRLKFSLMWANHDWKDIHPATRMQPYNVLLKGTFSEKVFFEAVDHMIRNYFCHPSYWRVNGGLYFSIYELLCLVKSLGSVIETRRVLDEFRSRVRKAGLGELHLNAVVWSIGILPKERVIPDVNDLIDKLGIDSITTYVWVHHNKMPDFPKTSYADYRALSVKEFEKFTSMYKLPYYPNVTMGWDSSPRTIQSDVFDNLGYPFTPILDGNTPKEFKQALIQAKEFLDKGLTKPKILTINAWNEWTEGSYLEPDIINGMGYLEAIKSVFME